MYPLNLCLDSCPLDTYYYTRILEKVNMESEIFLSVKQIRFSNRKAAISCGGGLSLDRIGVFGFGSFKSAKGISIFVNFDKVTSDGLFLAAKFGHSGVIANGASVVFPILKGCFRHIAHHTDTKLDRFALFRALSENGGILRGGEVGMLFNGGVEFAEIVTASVAFRLIDFFKGGKEFGLFRREFVASSEVVGHVSYLLSFISFP